MMKPLMQRPFTALPQRQRGAVIVLIVVALAAILLMGALALDGGHMLVNKTRLQNAVDAAALSGAKTLQQTMGSGNAVTDARKAALATLTLNANPATGNGELATAIGVGGVEAFADVEFSSSVYGDFTFDGPVEEEEARYVRVSVPEYRLSEFLWGILRATSDSDPLKAVAAIATAGPSPTNPCDIAPLMVCGETVPGAGPDTFESPPGTFWGYEFGDLEVLKSGAGGSAELGPGNFQLIRLEGNNGGNDIENALAGGVDQCHTVGEDVNTEPGNKVGPVASGLNTRFEDGGSSPYPPDLVITSNSPELKYDDTEMPPRIEHQDLPVTSTNGNLSTTSSPNLFDYNDWVQRSAECVAGTGGGCQANGAFERRMLKIVLGNCDGKKAGASDPPVPVLGFGCFFVLQPVSHQGNEAHIFGQFIEKCEGDNVAGPTPADDTGPQIIQLYKTYINGVLTPSTDS